MMNGSKTKDIEGSEEHHLLISFLIFIFLQDVVRLIKSRRMRVAESAPRRTEKRMYEGNMYLL